MTRQQLRSFEGYRVRGMDGLGDARPITQAIGSGLIATAGIVAAAGGPAGVLAGAIMAAVGSLTMLIGGLFQPDLTKIQATHIVDQIEAQGLKPMLAAWQALPRENKTRTMQAEFLKTFDEAWAAVKQACSNPALGEAGQRCISDRIQGSCHWTVGGATPGHPPDCGNWFVWFRDPIANDPNVIPDPSFGGAVGGSFDSAVSGVSSTLGVSPMILGIGLIAFGLLAVSD